MHAADVMTTNVVTISAETGVREIASLMLKHRVSALPVVDSDQRVLGIVSEGDLIRREESETEHRYSWWMEAFFSTNHHADRYIKTHGRKAGEIMTRDIVSVSEDTPLHKIADLLEKHHIKRVPVIRDQRIVGIC